MALSRLQNFLQSSTGRILHVNPADLNSSDSIENQGNTPLTPFKTINRALLEASRYSYVIGEQNDSFNFCTILLYPAEHLVDNRPGLVIDDTGSGFLRNGSASSLSQFDLNTVLDLTDPNNQLYLLNSVYGGVIIPRGTSIIAQDLRKTVLRPLYVPDSRSGDVERSAIFRVTGAAFFYSFSILDADPTGFCYKNYGTQKFTPNFSHHKLTAFEYVDGVSPVSISDAFLNVSTTRTDLEQYYEKISLIYGQSSGRPIDDVTYTGGVSVDIQPIIDEFRIVGPRGDTIGISSISSGNGITPSEVITVTLDQPATGISVDTSVQISGVDVNGYDGQFVVSAVSSENQIQYITPNIPTAANPAIFGATLNIISDTIASASPYIFNVSLRSVYGMCGLHADGSKVQGFKSVVVAQFTAVSLQKDNDAFVIYDEDSGTYLDSTVVPDLYKNTRSRYKPEFENFHIKVSNDAFAQLVSVFSIGYAAQIVAESGGDYSVTNSNSNFGAKTFISSGFKNDAFDQDDHGYIIGFVPPEEISDDLLHVNFNPINITLTNTVASGIASTNRLYLSSERNTPGVPANDINSPPTFFVDGFKLGVKLDEELYIEYPISASSKVVIPNTTTSYENSFTVERQNNDFENNISNGVITLTETHTFSSGEKVRVISENGHLPDGLDHERIYFVIDSQIDNTLTDSQIKLGSTFNNAISNTFIRPNRKGGKLSIVSRVSDKVPNEPGHPIQWDIVNSSWYVNVDPVNNGIYDAIIGIEQVDNEFPDLITSKTYVTRQYDNRLEEDKLYKLLYCIPKTTTTSARPPINGFILQESNENSLSGSEFNLYFNSTLTSETQIRNPKFISSATWESNSVTITTEIPHNLKVNDLVEIINVTPSGYNGTFIVTEVLGSRRFVYALTTDPGSFSNNTANRNSSLPYVKRKTTKNVFQIYKSEEVQEYIRDKQDGIYELTIIHNSVSPTITPFEDYSFSQPVKNLYPQLDRDNPSSNPQETVCFADHNIIGNVFVNEPKNSITKEAFNKFNSDLGIGIGVTGVISNQTGTAHTIFTSIEHGLSGISSISVVSVGASYIPGTYYGVGSTNVSSNGESASFRVVVGPDQTITAIPGSTSVDIMSAGSNYSVGDTISLSIGIGTTSGFVPAVIEITGVQNNLTDHSISLNGFTGDYSGYNDSYIISSSGTPKSLVLESSGAISGFSTGSISVDAVATFNGKVLGISTFTGYSSSYGLISTVENHGITGNIGIRIVGFTSEYKLDIEAVGDGADGFLVNIGSLPTSGFGKVIVRSLDPVSGDSRIKYYYDGGKTQLASTLLKDGIILNVNDPLKAGFNVGDYIECNGEIMRIKTPLQQNFDFVTVYRAQFGTSSSVHAVDSVVRKIRITPVELRRNSIIRASGHTFEYVGYGAGNYSTSLPENQDREIGKVERLLSQANKIGGGTIYYTGMDENGDFYSANKKLSSSTGEEEVYDLPTPTITGESSAQESINIINSQKIVATDSLKVEGGPNNDVLSVFNGPVVFNEKITAYSDKGIETPSIFLKGSENISREYTISGGIPSTPGNVGDISFRSNPENGNNLGWVYTTSNEWKSWGFVGESGTQLLIYSGEEFGLNTLEGIVNKVKFVGDPSGFGVDVDIEVDTFSELATIVLRNPVDVVNFGTDLGSNTPTFGVRSSGTRVIYYDSLANNRVDYAVGVNTTSGGGDLWWSIPQQNNNFFNYVWYAGQTQIMRLNSAGQLSVLNGISGTLFGDVEGNAFTADFATNLRRRVIAGAGLTGGGQLDQDRVLAVNVAPNSGISFSPTTQALQLDSTVFRTNTNLNITGITTFTNPINGSITGIARSTATILRNGVNSNEDKDFRVLLGENSNQVGYSSCFVVQDATRLTYNPLNDTLNVNISGTSQITNTVNTITRNRTDIDAGIEYVTFVKDDNRGGTSAPEEIRTSSGLYYDSSNFNLSCRGDITAFAGAASDDRLKENKQPIENPLEKIDSITGFTYNWNKKAHDLGLSSTDSQIGVSAQEVQKVLPEVVQKQKLEDEEILIVKYEKMIPLLIESIKELNKEVATLKKKIEILESSK
jgi:hypothetical protein